MKITRHLLVFAFLFLPGVLIAAEHFDGTWHTKVVCPDKGKTMGFTWNFDSVVTNSNLRGVHGTEGQPASFVLALWQRHHRLKKICPHRHLRHGRFIYLGSQSPIQRHRGKRHEERRPRHHGPPVHLRFRQAAGRSSRPGSIEKRPFTAATQAKGYLCLRMPRVSLLRPAKPQIHAVVILPRQMLPNQPVHQRHQMLTRPRQHKSRSRLIPVQLEAG